MRQVIFDGNMTDQEAYDLIGKRIFFIKEGEHGESLSIVGIIQTVVLSKVKNGYCYQVKFHLQGGESFIAIRSDDISTELFILD